MNHFERSNLQIFADAKRRAVNHYVWNYLRQATAEVRRLKDVLEEDRRSGEEFLHHEPRFIREGFKNHFLSIQGVRG